LVCLSHSSSTTAKVGNALLNLLRNFKRTAKD
jgi:hypothetical protein